LKISDIVDEKESQDYFGCSFKLGGINIKYRKAKITPKKIGQFVALWKRNTEGKTEPFSLDDNFDYYIIATDQEDNSGCFIFPKNVLGQKQILSEYQKEGKRGFRVYTEWDIPANRQAQNTKSWQVLYFVDLSKNRELSIDRIKSIVK
jgi:hypothetical protein